MSTLRGIQCSVYVLVNTVVLNTSFDALVAVCKVFLVSFQPTMYQHLVKAEWPHNWMEKLLSFGWTSP